jgi:hypothetical protein
MDRLIRPRAAKNPASFCLAGMAEAGAGAELPNIPPDDEGAEMLPPKREEVLVE